MDILFEPSLYGRYVLLNKIAAGGMAEVFRAKSYGAEDFEKLIAIKRLYPHLCEDISFVKMFINEAKLAATLNHVNVTPIFDFGRQQGLYYIAMEYVRGCDLADLIARCRERNQALPLGLSIWVLIEICNGLDYAHRKHDDLGHFLNLIHRDITPQNILISYEGEVKITDFGIAKVQMLERDETTGGILKGKFSYMSPEQVRGERMDHRSDIFSLGIVAWELLTCQKMFDGPNDYHILEKVREALFIPPRQLNPELPPALEQIVMKALTRHPQERYGSVGELRLALLRLLSSSRLFPSRAHLSAFVRKLFQDKLQREQQEIVTETGAARKIWQQHNGHLGRQSYLMSMTNLPALPQNTGPVEVLASAPPNPILSPSSDTLRPPGGQLSGGQSGFEPQRSAGGQITSGSQFPVAAFLPELALGLDDDEDPTLPDVLEPSPDERTAASTIDRRPPQVRVARGAPQALVPQTLPAAIPPPHPGAQPLLPAQHLVQSGQLGHGQPFSPFDEDEVAYQPANRRKNLSFLIGISTFVVGVVLVLMISQWLGPADPPTNNPNTSRGAIKKGTPNPTPERAPAPHTPSRLVVTSQPWARVYLNGRLLNRTPLDERITPGKYRVTVLFPNLSRGLRVVKKTYNLELTPGRTHTIQAKPR